MAIATAVLDVIDEEKLQEKCEALGDYMMKKLREVQREHRQIGDVRGSGLMIGIELVKEGTDEPDQVLAVTIAKR